MLQSDVVAGDSVDSAKLAMHYRGVHFDSPLFRRSQHHTFSDALQNHPFLIVKSKNEGHRQGQTGLVYIIDESGSENNCQQVNSYSTNTH